jgi:hypothetical protein
VLQLQPQFFKPMRSFKMHTSKPSSFGCIGMKTLSAHSFATCRSGPTAFMNDNIAYPLAIDGLSEVRSDGDPNFFQAFIGQQWAQPSVKHLTQLLLHVYR